jgi:hypothetical protein
VWRSGNTALEREEWGMESEEGYRREKTEKASGEWEHKGRKG